MKQLGLCRLRSNKTALALSYIHSMHNKSYESTAATFPFAIIERQIPVYVF